MLDIIPIIILLFVVSIIVVALCYFYLKNVELRDERARKIEILGYVTLLIVIVWEFGIKNVLMSGFYNSDIFYISQKLDYIYNAVTDGTIQSYGNPSYWNMRTNDAVETQILAVNVLEALLQIFSATCIAIGRVQELLKYRGTGDANASR
jgi:hypothetical protein